MLEKKTSARFVGSASTLYRGFGVTVSPTKSDMDVAAEAFQKGYVREIRVMRQRVNEKLLSLYGKEIPFSEKIVSDVLQKIQYIERTTRNTMEGISSDLKAVLGQDFKFFYNKEGKEYPISSDKILEAYQNLKQKQPVEKIKTILS